MLSFPQSIRRWFDAGTPSSGSEPSDRPGHDSGVLRLTAAERDRGDPDRADWLRLVPFFAMHGLCLLVPWTGVSATALITCVSLYVLRMFAVTGFYHRYFSHRAFETSRGMQFVFAVLGNSAAQRGPLWWASHHRWHHKHADTDRDAHHPMHGFWWSHFLWWTTRRNFVTHLDRVPDLAKYPELRALDRFNALVPVLLIASLGVTGSLLERFAPALGTDWLQMIVWGFGVSTVVLFHATSTINSLGHRVGRRRYQTKDSSTNSLRLALLTFGEGWHNNHHHYPVSARQGFFWWEIDLTYYGLRCLAALGLIWDLRPVPAAVRNEVDRVRATP